MRRLALILVAAFTAVLIAACATKPQLLPINGVNTSAIDLSGNWILRQESGSPLATAGVEEQTVVIPRRKPANSQAAQRAPQKLRSKGSAVHVFLESGTSLKITQTLHGIFISFDRAVVEEFTFGENRIVSIGPIEGQRVSGWDGSEFIAKTMGEKGAVLAERWSLAEGGDVLVRDISVIEKDKLRFSTRQVFDRQ